MPRDDAAGILDLELAFEHAFAQITQQGKAADYDSKQKTIGGIDHG